MHIEFLGAAGEVTGSCHLLTVGGRRVLLDCGLVQGSRTDEARNAEPFAFDPASIDAVVLSHSHIDHAGRLPLLVKAGYRGPIYTHGAARDLCEILLRDAAFINEKEVEWENRKRERKGLAPRLPLYSRREAERAMQRFVSLNYNETHTIVPGVSLRLHDAGHILGSSIVELELEEKGRRCRLVFSGDLGHSGAAIMRDPSVLSAADLVILESTYGDRPHRSQAETLDEMAAVLREADAAGGNVLIPAFAVGRSQELLYLFGRYFKEWDLAHWRIVLDSPLAIEATEIYVRHSELFDAEARELFGRQRRLPVLPNLSFTRTAAQSMALNRAAGGTIIMAGSGMCNGGRIKHHLKHNAWRRDCHIVMVGFQGRGTLGRALVDGAKHIRLWGETIRVNAKVHTLGGFSAHADQGELSRWYGHFQHKPRLVLVHGETDAQQALVQRIRDDHGVTAHIAARGESLALPTH
ncbi:MAG: MBL fold metallo-hydrolase [Proteobacteria bacterium]|nr:MBL fold metallo-hydrolase [Pseudomonadota bacterium]